MSEFCKIPRGKGKELQTDAKQAKTQKVGSAKEKYKENQTKPTSTKARRHQEEETRRGSERRRSKNERKRRSRNTTLDNALMKGNVATNNKDPPSKQ